MPTWTLLRAQAEIFHKTVGSVNAILGCRWWLFTPCWCYSESDRVGVFRCAEDFVAFRDMQSNDAEQGIDRHVPRSVGSEERRGRLF